MSNPVFRQATLDDAEAVASIINAVVEEPNPVGFDGPTTPDNVRTWLTRQGDAGGIFLCLIDEEAVGFSALDFDTQEPDISVLGVWLLPKHRRKGLGTSLAELALDFALGPRATVDGRGRSCVWERRRPPGTMPCQLRHQWLSRAIGSSRVGGRGCV